MARDPLDKTSQHRRRQNALAQRNYRARQKERRRMLENLAISSIILPSTLDVSCTHGVAAAQQNDQDRAVGPSQLTKAICPTIVDADFHSPDIAPGFTASDFFSCIDSCPETERRTFFLLMTKELFGIRDIIKYGLIFLGYPVSSSLYNNAMHLPMNQWLQDVQQSLGSFDLRAATKAGVSILGKLNIPSGHNSRIHEIVTSPLSHFQPRDYILLCRISFVSAVFMNARHLGIIWHDLISFESKSPFPRLREKLIQQELLDDGEEPTEQAAQMRLILKDYLKNIQSDLVPTQAQLTMSHHPTLDLIPWPKFRSKAITAVHSTPPLIDREDFCLDLLNDGLRCWGFANGSSLPSAAPWDAQNWEAAPWFLEKWEHLTEGRDGDEWKISARWWSMGARSSV
ncbi:hypothetical protein FOXG_21881 [Fusarium oxysporum f. sp. lycopersici 4287]|uniref:BZIP domain-containing protein n=2 Tax=Fusarium oxysporum TaxID=5507 RepID=A0A0J9W2X0_FUSO4|nr:hypothetical protein FOXG_21881 [Fusarium oxysporum f. sp. lycopersici 4287]EXK43357.1 hypothetical protein FOMG_05979 [Fusarium oxysporum f. sp. melonis 26406]KAJ9424511.1 hypothetical protein QL093DRAFT_2216251 [Fusarium oxysporum]KNB17195.1 hypothetical protein FOXG_21881 [Fusarium oxysporum f. sp. lycopersici 4287]